MNETEPTEAATYLPGISRSDVRTLIATAFSSGHQAARAELTGSNHPLSQTGPYGLLDAMESQVAVTGTLSHPGRKWWARTGHWELVDEATEAAPR
jgi:hypothetical protein